MQRRLAMSILALATPLLATATASALCPMEPIMGPANTNCPQFPQPEPDPDPPPPARQCTVTIPVPADAFDCACKTTGRDPAQRCSGALPQATCFSMIDSAFAIGLLTSDAAAWLKAVGFCPIHFNAGDGDLIYDFCPMGCFAADTQLLTTVPHAGKSGYQAASRITGQDTLMTLTDEATLSDVMLATRSIDRVVSGPEEPPLFVFGLATGATLRVTQHHPMVLDNGKIVEASQLARGMALVGVDGQRVAITAITRAPAVGDVFNFQTAGDTQLSHVIVAEGVLVGDLKLQNELAAEQSSIAARR